MADGILDGAQGASAQNLTDIRPEHRVSSHTAWTQAIAWREDIAALISAELEQHKLKGNILRSPNGTYPVWIRLDAWLPVEAGEVSKVQDTRVRASLQFTIDIRPYHSKPLVIWAEAHNGRRTLRLSERVSFSDDRVREWFNFAIRGGSKPGNYTPFQDALGSLIMSFIPFAENPYVNQVQKLYRNRFRLNGIFLLILAGAIALVWGITDVNQPYYSRTGAGELLIFAGVGMLVGAGVIAARRQKVIAVIDRPDIPPRNLILVDGWYAVIPGLGSKLEDVRSRIAGRLKSIDADAVTVEQEAYTFSSPNGFEERERFVVSKGQGVAHVHIYRFGTDVFVGWDSYLNWAKWGETAAVSSQSASNMMIEFRSLQEQIYIPSEYDLIDLNSLGEVVHRTMSDEVRLLMTENAIDQEIDFQIIRGDRDAALDKGRHDKRQNDQKRAKSGRRRWKIS